MSDVGFVLIYRSLLGHPAFRNDAEAMAFAWLVIRAQWRDTRVRYKDRQIDLRRGQLAVSVRDWAGAMDRDKAWIERLLKRLKSETMVETDTKIGVLVITICNYAQFQAEKDRRETVDETAAEAANETGARQAQDTEQRREQDNKIHSVAEATGADAPDDGDQGQQPDMLGYRDDDVLVDPEAIMFSAGRALLMEGGLTYAAAGRALGRWKKFYAPEAVIVALGVSKREGAIDPVPFIEACLRNGARNGHSQPGGGAADERTRGARPSPALDLLRAASRAAGGPTDDRPAGGGTVLALPSYVAN